MNIIVGLGNPGGKYIDTRHNTGFLVLDDLRHQVRNLTLINSDGDFNFRTKKKWQAQVAKTGTMVLVKPITFMNNSGLAVKKVLQNLQPFDLKTLFVVHDDLDLNLGQFKIQWGKGPKKHLGLLSVEKEVGTDQFWRVRVGVRGPGYQKIKMSAGQTMAEDYLLKPFAQTERKILTTVITQINQELLTSFKLG
jgi:PTH1 family peptidyl-tRNA hydrolase